MRDIRQKSNLGNKILIIGCAGSGKTTLAKHLAKLIGLPIIHLDNYYWCLFHVFIRRFRLFHNRKRNDIPTNCNERLNLEFYRWIWNYPKRSRKQTLDLLNSSNKTIFHLKTNHDMHVFIKKLLKHYQPIIQKRFL